MPEDSATSTYIIPEPFDRAVQLVREVLANSNVRIASELNMSGQFQRGLLIETAPCQVLFVCPERVPENFAADLPNATLAPLHIVVSSRNSQTEVHVLRALPRDSDAAAAPVATPVLCRLLRAMTHAIESVGMRTRLGA